MSFGVEVDGVGSRFRVAINHLGRSGRGRESFSGSDQPFGAKWTGSGVGRVCAHPLHCFTSAATQPPLYGAASVTTRPPSIVLSIKRYPPRCDVSTGMPIATLIHVMLKVPGAPDRSSPTDPPLGKYTA
jgi:hypothetical protein